jgi:hypothetical protein
MPAARVFMGKQAFPAPSFLPVFLIFLRQDWIMFNIIDNFHYFLSSKYADGRLPASCDGKREGIRRRFEQPNNQYVNLRSSK